MTMTLSPLRCEQTGMHYLLLDIMRALFDHNSAQLVLSQKRSRSFSMRAGLLQGSFLSPLLYSIFLDPLKLMVWEEESKEEAGE
jgi:hypothetical protein